MLSQVIVTSLTVPVLEYFYSVILRRKDFTHASTLNCLHFQVAKDRVTLLQWTYQLKKDTTDSSGMAA